MQCTYPCLSKNRMHRRISNNNKCIYNAPNHSVIYTYVMLKTLYMIVQNRTKPNLIIHYINQSVPHCPTQMPMRTCTHTDTHTHTHTLPAPLSGTFLQTLPDLVTPLKGHSLSPRSCPATRSAPSERFGY